VLENREAPASGAIARVSWRREVFESRPAVAQPLAEARSAGAPTLANEQVG
jgi:hypothetical protein